MKALASFCVFTSLVIAAPALAGVVFDMETKDLSTSEVTTSQVFAQGRQLKITVQPAKDDKKRGHATMIFHADRREMMVFDDDAKTYFVLDEATIKSMVGQMKDAQGQADQAMEQMKQALENVPEEQRAMVEKMMKEHAGGKAMGMAQGSMPKRSPAELKKTGESKTVNGFATTKYEVYRDKQKTSEMWVTGWDKIEGGKEVAALFGEMADFFRDMMDSFSKETGMTGMAAHQMNDAMFEYMKDMNGIPVLAREFDNGKAANESSLRSSKRATLDAATFQAPKGYTKQTMGAMEGSK